MNVEREFVDRLCDVGLKAAGEWIEEWFETHPWDQHARACRALIYAVEKRPEAREEAEAVLGLSPFNDWGLGAMFLLTDPDPTDENSFFIGTNGYLVPPKWTFLYFLLDYPDKAMGLYQMIKAHGSEEQKTMLAKEFDDVPELYSDYILNRTKWKDERQRRDWLDQWRKKSKTVDEELSDEKIFDQFLLKRQLKTGLEWVFDEIKKRPQSIGLKALASFGLLIVNMEKEAKTMAKLVLSTNHYNKWAMTVMFACTPDSIIEEMPEFFSSKGFYLNSLWYLRLDRLGLKAPARRLWGFIARYGPEVEKWELLKSEFGVDRRGGLNS